MAQKILIVEDDNFLRTLLSRRFKNEGFEVIESIDGEDAYEKVIRSKPDLILLDIILPKKSGFTFLSEIKQDPNLASIPVIIITQLGQPQDVEKGRELGVQEYIVKANTPLDTIVESVKSTLQSLWKS